MFTKHEVNAMVQKRAEELRGFRKMSVSDSNQEFINSNSSEEDEV